MTNELDIVAVPFRVMRHHAFDGGVLEVRRYFWSRVVDETFRSFDDELVLNLALTSRPAHTQINRIEADAALPGRDAGRLLVMMPKAPYHLTAPVGAVQSLHCSLTCAKIEQVCGEAIDWDALMELGGELRPGTRIEQLLTQMHDELTHERAGRGAVIDACVTILCVELFRRFRESRPRRPDLRAGGLATWRMRALVERVNADRPAPRVTELAELCGLTSRQLSRAFKAETGMTIGRYVDEATMERAHRMLTSTRLTIAEIARELGFAGPDSFAQAFRRVTGNAPSQMR